MTTIRIGFQLRHHHVCIPKSILRMRDLHVTASRTQTRCGTPLTSTGTPPTLISSVDLGLSTIQREYSSLTFSSRRFVHRDESASFDDAVRCTVDNGVRTIMLNRPEKKNALTLEMFKQFMRALYESNDDDNTTVIAITGSGDFFTSGIDMSSSFSKTTKSTESQKPQPALQSETSSKQPPPFINRVMPFLDALIQCDKPIIALVNGPALGMGVTMLGLVDGVYASETAYFRTDFTKFGVIPELASTYTFPLIMGHSRASRILVHGQQITATEAYEYGLVSRIFPKDDFHEETSKILKQFGSLPVKSLIFSKQLVRGREKDILRHTCDEEQKRFDPSMAKKAKEAFLQSRKFQQ